MKLFSLVYYQLREQKQKLHALRQLTCFHFIICVLFQPSYTPAQFENSLGKLQCVTVKAPRQIIDVGVVRVADNNPTVRWDLQT